jgi:hypothetical protein
LEVLQWRFDFAMGYVYARARTDVYSFAAGGSGRRERVAATFYCTDIRHKGGGSRQRTAVGEAVTVRN